MSYVVKFWDASDFCFPCRTVPLPDFLKKSGVEESDWTELLGSLRSCRSVRENLGSNLGNFNISLMFLIEVPIHKYFTGPQNCNPGTHLPSSSIGCAIYFFWALPSMEPIIARSWK